MKNNFSRRSLFTFSLLSIVFLGAACNSDRPDSVPIRETVIVELPITVVVTQPATVVEVEVTRVVEVQVTNDGVNKNSLEGNAIFSETPVATEYVTSTPSYFKPHPYGDYTDVHEVDVVARSVLSRNLVALRELIRLQPHECIHKNDPGGPVCNEDEPIGTLVDSFSYGYCEWFSTRDEATIINVLQQLVSEATGVYAAYGNSVEESYGIVFTSVDNDNAIIVLVKNMGISEVRFGCGNSPEDVLLNGYGDILLPPVSASQE
jgi:hypothetical protein